MRLKQLIAVCLVAVMTLQSGLAAEYYTVPVYAETTEDGSQDETGSEETTEQEPEQGTEEEPEVDPSIIKDGDTVLVNKNVFLIEEDGAYTIAKPGAKGSALYVTDEEGRASLYEGTKVKPLKIYYNGKEKTYVIKNGELYTGLYTKNDKKYCYVKGLKYVGELTTTTSMNNKKIQFFTKKLNDKMYAFNQNSVMYSNQIIGKYYYDKAGVRNKNKQITQAVAFVKKHGGSNNSRASKLKKCFQYLANRNYYSHDSDHTAKLATTSGLPKAANKMLKDVNKGKGNCFGWASAYAYIATVLGYPARVCKGTTKLTSGGMGPHGWTMVKYDGEWKICDANMHYKKNCYMKTYKNYPFKLGKSKTYFSLTAKNGKATWKEL